MMRKFILVLLIGLFLLAGCSPAEPPQATQPAGGPAAAETEAYPASGYPYPPAIDTGYPAAQEAPAEEVAALPPLEMNPGTGAVEGQFIYRGEPLVGMNFYLASFITDADGNEYAASINPQKSPFAVSDSAGMVRFNNVPPGKYGVVLEVDVSSFLLMTPKGDVGLTVMVEDQKVADMGKLEYQDLPLNP